MLTYAKLASKPSRVQRFTSLTKDQFETLALHLQPLWEKAETKRLSYQGRKRGIGAGRRYKIATIEDKLLLTLMFYRTYVNYDLLELLFSLENSQIYRLLRKVEPLVEKAADPYLLGKLKRVGNTAKRIKTIEEFIERFPDMKDIIIDATEQRRLKSQDRKKERESYSGKKKYHTLKTQIITDSKGLILSVSKTVGGRTHDMKLLRSSSDYHYLPCQANKLTDLGYEGLLKDHIPKVKLPIKRRYLKGKTYPLTEVERKFNTKLSRKRSVVETVFARLKKYNILNQTYRSSEERYNQIFRNVAALVNLRLSYRLATV